MDDEDDVSDWTVQGGLLCLLYTEVESSTSIALLLCWNLTLCDLNLTFLRSMLWGPEGWAVGSRSLTFVPFHSYLQNIPWYVQIETGRDCNDPVIRTTPGFPSRSVGAVRERQYDGYPLLCFASTASRLYIMHVCIVRDFSFCFTDLDTRSTSGLDIW
ncbi:hypothetical protein BU23DRAFT_183849 [Bimuria novae-zelandiae CBS 107.79]|uniref:Uncharacterized protein n=1 Tax=Bimuria novae-zelandiae CBS 107.79 TaxID=1447943 RepID=A0A6A5V4E3_9PLEO|nr:hypothetical protein BU23DRAFT_183849 [Bimuria novae-zelandiae CBS 107.79]